MPSIIILVIVLGVVAVGIIVTIAVIVKIKRKKRLQVETSRKHVLAEEQKQKSAEEAKTLTHEKAQQDQRMMETQQQQKVMIERGALEKLKKLVKVSTKLKISQITQILKMSESDLYDHIVDWASDYGFTLDENVVMFSSGRKDDFIASLDNAFADWGKKTETKDGKPE